MKSEQLLLARKLLLSIEQGEVISTQTNVLDSSRSGFNEYTGEVIEWLLETELLTLADVFPISQYSSVEVLRVSERGGLVGEFEYLAEMAMEDSQVANERFMKAGGLIYHILSKYHEGEITGVLTLLTSEEQTAYNRYYTLAFQDALKGRGNTVETPAQELGLDLSTMFDMSVSIGPKNSDSTRTDDYVLKKCTEELGELSVEIQIEQGSSYKQPGKDGVAGEAVDLAICAMDMFALQYPGLTSKEIQDLFIHRMNQKITKWKETLSASR